MLQPAESKGCHEDIVNDTGREKPHKPSIRIEGLKEGGDGVDGIDFKEKAPDIGRDSQDKGRQGLWVKARRIPIGSLRFVEIIDIENLFANDKIIHQENGTDGPKNGTVGDEPGENVAGGIGDEFPRHDENVQNRRQKAADFKVDFLRGHIGKIVRRADDVGRNVGTEGGETDDEHGDKEKKGRIKALDNGHGIPKTFSVDDLRGLGHDGTDEGKGGHGRGKSGGLPEKL